MRWFPQSSPTVLFGEGNDVGYVYRVSNINSMTDGDRVPYRDSATDLY